MKTGWNTWTSNGSISQYRYFRITPSATSNLSRCNIAEVKFFGPLLYSGSSTLASTTCNTLIQMNGSKFWAYNSVEYRQDATPVVKAMNPILGSTAGGTTVTLTGTGFGTDNTKVNVVMDGIACVVGTVTSTSITCTTGKR